MPLKLPEPGRHATLIQTLPDGNRVEYSGVIKEWHREMGQFGGGEETIELSLIPTSPPLCRNTRPRFDGGRIQYETPTKAPIVGAEAMARAQAELGKRRGQEFHEAIKRFLEYDPSSQSYHTMTEGDPEMDEFTATYVRDPRTLMFDIFIQNAQGGYLQPKAGSAVFDVAEVEVKLGEEPPIFMSVPEPIFQALRKADKR